MVPLAELRIPLAKLAVPLAELGVRSEAYAFAPMPAEALRYAIDPEWAGEKPRAYRYSAQGTREAITGVIERERFLGRAAE